MSFLNILSVSCCERTRSPAPVVAAAAQPQLIRCNAIRAAVVGNVMHRDLRAENQPLILLPLSITLLSSIRYKSHNQIYTFTASAHGLFTFHESHAVGVRKLPTKFILVDLTIVSALPKAVS